MPRDQSDRMEVTREPDYRAIAAEETRELRHAVLHPGRDGDALLCASDRDIAALHIGAFDGVAVIGVGSVWPEALPDSQYPAAWRIAGMAVDPAWRGVGVGGEILGRLLTHASAHGGNLAWCNSRPAAVRLYRRYGFTRTPSLGSPPADEPRERMTSRLDKGAPVRRTTTDDDGGIRRIDVFPRLSRAVIFKDTLHIGGLLANRADVTVGEQTREILDQIDTLLTRTGTSRSRLISATIWLKDLDTVREANAVWEAWVPAGSAPARACVQAVPGAPEFAVEIAVIAAL
jgi:enamine deaminase RidA (YjgF/YER057c/UK114 family)